jgi:hypothetical protein
LLRQFGQLFAREPPSNSQLASKTDHTQLLFEIEAPDLLNDFVRSHPSKSIAKSKNKQCSNVSAKHK